MKRLVLALVAAVAVSGCGETADTAAVSGLLACNVGDDCVTDADCPVEDNGCTTYSCHSRVCVRDYVDIGSACVRDNGRAGVCGFGELVGDDTRCRTRGDCGATN